MWWSRGHPFWKVGYVLRAECWLFPSPILLWLAYLIIGSSNIRWTLCLPVVLSNICSNCMVPVYYISFILLLSESNAILPVPLLMWHIFSSINTLYILQLSQYWCLQSYDTCSFCWVNLLGCLFFLLCEHAFSPVDLRTLDIYNFLWFFPDILCWWQCGSIYILGTALYLVKWATYREEVILHFCFFLLIHSE